jgi:hypothetical protein
MLKYSLFLILIWTVTVAQSQDFSRHSIRVATGLSSSTSGGIDGLGSISFIGYQKESPNRRLRHSYNLGLGEYDSRYITDLGDQYFTSSSLEIDLFYDLVRIRSFSLMIGGGASLIRIRGLIVDNGHWAPPFFPATTFINRFYYGGSLAAGFRVNPPSNRCAFNLVPLAIRIGNKGLLEQHIFFGVDIKL